MNLVATRARAAVSLVATLALAALVLSNCANAKVVTVHLDGTPAISISVPLSNVGCTLNDVCVAVGTSDESVGPTATGEFSTPTGRWLNLPLPSARSPLITSIACAGAQCLLGGSIPGGDLLWRFSAKTHALTVLTPPPGAIGVDALTCQQLACSLVDTADQGGSLRFTSSSDGGMTWNTPTPVPWARGDAITSLSCGAATKCVLSALTQSHQLSLYATLNGGATWSERTTPSSWSSLSSLSCQLRRCVALVNAGGTSMMVRSVSFAKSWTSVNLAKSANALACSSTICVVAGAGTNEGPWLATYHDSTFSDVSLRYVPTPLLDVACGSKECAAIGVTTLLSVPSTL